MRWLAISVYSFFIFSFFCFADDSVKLNDDFKYVSVAKNLKSVFYFKKEEYGPELNGNKIFFPQGISVDDNGAVYVCNSENKEILIFKDEKVKILKNVDYPVDIEIVSPDFFVFSDKNDYSVKYMYSDGLIFSKIGGSQGIYGLKFAFPCGIFLTKNKTLYVTDRVNDRIKVIDEFGSLIYEYSRSGLNLGDLNQPTDVFVYGKKVYVANYGNDRIDVYDKKFNYLFSFGERGKNITQFRGPYGMTGDNEGNLYVCDYFNGRIQKFDKNGNFIACIGEGVLGLPRFVALDINGNVYVTDDLKNKIFVFSPAVFVKGIEFFEKKDYEKAAFYFEKEIKRDDKNLNARYYLAYCYFKLKKYDEVVRIKNETDKLGLKGYPKELIDVLYNKVIKWYEEK